MAVPKIFLSHSSQDSNVAKSIKETLANHTRGEIEWWLSSDGQSIRGGKNWRSEVEQALRDCQLLFILFTPFARQSAWVHYEAGFADALGKEIIPIALPGLDIDAVPGPLQHKQGFNLRGASGLNNILSLSNQILARHDLLSFTEEDYERTFASFIEHDELPRLLDNYIKTARLSLQILQKISPVLAMHLADAQLTTNDKDNEQILAGPGFVLREGSAVVTSAGTSEKIIKITGELTGSALLDVISALAHQEVIAELQNGGEFHFVLRKGTALSTNQAEILAKMRGTAMKWAGQSILSFEELTFFPQSYDANSRGRVYIRPFGIASAPEPYRPKDMRYELHLRWSHAFPSNSIRTLVELLIERQVIFPNRISSEW